MFGGSFTIKHAVMFTLGVFVANLVINQIGPLRDLQNKQYFGA